MRRPAAALVIVAVLGVAAVCFVTCRPIVPHEAPPVRPETSRVDDRVPSRVRTRPVGAAPSADGATDPQPTEHQHSVEEFQIEPDHPIDLPVHLLRGRVVDRDGRPAPDTGVELISTWLPEEVGLDFEIYGDPWPHARDVARTGADGRFALRWYDGGPRSLYVWYRKRAALTDCAVVDGEDVEIVFAPSGVRVAGRVTREDGSPSRGTKVVLVACGVPIPPNWQDLLPWSAEPTTDDSGRFTVDDAPVGLLSVSAYPEAAADQPASVVRIPPHGTDAIEIHILPAFVVTGCVTAATSGLPLRDVEVRGPDRELKATTGPDGRYRIERVPGAAGQVIEFTASREPDYADARKTAGYTDDSKREVVLDFALVRPATIRLRCVDLAGKALQHVVVAVDVGGKTHADMTGADGRFDSVNLTAGAADSDVTIRFWVAGVLVADRKVPSLAAGERRDIGDVILGPR